MPLKKLLKKIDMLIFNYLHLLKFVLTANQNSKACTGRAGRVGSFNVKKNMVALTYFIVY